MDSVDFDSRDLRKGLEENLKQVDNEEDLIKTIQQLRERIEELNNIIFVLKRELEEQKVVSEKLEKKILAIRHFLSLSDIHMAILYKEAMEKKRKIENDKELEELLKNLGKLRVGPPPSREEIYKDRIDKLLR